VLAVAELTVITLGTVAGATLSEMRAKDCLVLRVELQVILCKSSQL